MADQCETPEYDEGPCHCAYHDPANARDERIGSYYEQSARELAESLVDAEDEAAQHRAEYRKVMAICAGQIRESDRYRLAWLSARRRAADEANFGMEALDLLRAEMAQAETEHRAFVAALTPIMGKRMNELRRAHAFVAEVQDVRGWCMTGDTYRTHLTPIYDALNELQSATDDERPFRPRIQRRADAGDFDDVHEADEVRKSTSGTRRLECVGVEEDGGTVWQLADESPESS